MSAEEQVEDVLDESVEDAAEEVVEETVDPDEEVARQYGWKPQEEFDGPADQWVSAKVFNQRGELFGKIKSLESQNREMQKALKQTQTMIQKNYESGYKKAMQELEQQKREAIENADAEQAFAIDKEIDSLKSDYESSAKQEEQGPPQEFIEWKDKNPWYLQDDEMSRFADEIGIVHAKMNPNKPLSEVYEYVSNRVRSEFPDKFSNGKKMKESKVEGSRPGGGKAPKGKQKYTEADLSEDQRKIMNTMVRSGAMSKDEYIKELVRIGEVGQ